MIFADLGARNGQDAWDEEVLSAYAKAARMDPSPGGPGPPVAWLDAPFAAFTRPAVT